MDAFSYRQPLTGQPFAVQTEGAHNQVLSLNAYAGRYTLICCFGSTQIEAGRAAIAALAKQVSLFDGVFASFLGVTLKTSEELPIPPSPGIKVFFDREGELSRQCGASPLDEVPLGRQYRVTWTLVDPGLKVIAHALSEADGAGCESVFEYIKTLPEPDAYPLTPTPAPILVLPHVFAPDLCDQLIGLYEKGDPHDSGYMVDNVEKFDHSFKRRSDYFVTDEALQQTIRKRIAQCVCPDIKRLFFMDATYMERFLVGCYTSEDDGHFRPHRDNGQQITAHRRYAVSVALNEEFEGGELMFPEYNRVRHRLRKGWAIVFPCAILHAVTRVRRGRRYAFLPFLYDEAATQSRSRV